MADCGASGSTLDRAARALGAHDGGKHLSSWLGHVAVGSAVGPSAAATQVVPVVSPDHIVIPSSAPPASARSARSRSGIPAPSPIMAPPADPALRIASRPSSMAHDPAAAHPRPLHHAAAAPMHQYPYQQHHPVAARSPAGMMISPPPMHPFMAAQQHQFHHQQLQYHHQQQAMAAMAAQQQHMVMVQHQQLVRMRQQQLQQQQTLVAAARGRQAVRHESRPEHQEADRDAEDVDEEDDEEDSEEEEEEEEEGDEEEEEGYRGHEGSSHPVRIEELATAWAEAQAEYEELEEAVNLAAAAKYYADGFGERPERYAYEFVNQVGEGADLAARDAGDPQNDFMAEGMSHFARGDLGGAIRAFETELQTRNPDSAEAWRMLGRCHAENDQDQMAIACLEQAVDRDPRSSEARLALGVSQVNELQHAAALDNLKAWITNNPKYAGLVRDASTADTQGATDAEGRTVEAAFDEVQRLLLEALSIDPGADVLEALGVVYNVSRDYEAAVDAFTRAVALQPDNYQLYNRLGATLANCGQSDKALPMYHKALELRPRYARAWLNSAISFSNLREYDDAARCYLQTLSINPAATHCWSYLRIALSCSEKWDLIPLAAAMDLGAFREHFDFILYDPEAP